MQTVNKPLSIEVSGDGSNEAKRGTTTKRRVVVNNKGSQPAEVDVWITATNDLSEVSLRWCTFSQPNPLKIDANSQETVELSFEIPLDAAPGLYNYEILVDAQAQYPGKLDRRPQQLRVLPSDQDTELDNEPVFSLQPATSSTHPYPLVAGESLDVKVRVENRSKRVDRFYVTWAELDQSWVSIRYPESMPGAVGLARETDGLELNPGKSGEITLLIHPPQYTPAGDYFPTIRLTSKNKEELVLLDVVYLRILPDERVEVQIHPPRRQIPTEPGEFTVEITNLGNIQRQLILQADDRDALFTYTLTPFIVKPVPGETQTVELKAKTKKWWRRSWREGFEFPFEVELENLRQHPLNLVQLPALPEAMPQGTIHWQSHPWWRFWLLILLALGALGAIAFMIWRTFFYQPPPLPTPKILMLESVKVVNPQTKKKEPKAYQEGYVDAIRLDWQISHPDRIEKATLIRLENNVETDRKTFYLGGQVPDPLQRKDRPNNFCEKAKVEALSRDREKQQIEALNCIGIITSAQKAGNYVFELQVFAKEDKNAKRDFSQPVATLKTDTIAIQAALPPKIIEFASIRPSYQEVIAQTTSPRITSSPTSTTPRTSTTPATSSTPLPSPRPVPAPPSTGLVRLNWEVSAPNQIKELRVIGLAPDGSIGSPLKRYLFVDGKIPAELEPYCDQPANLICQDVPTEAAKPGDYTFKLTVIPKQAADQEIVKATDVIKILPQKPKTPKISFFVDGQNVAKIPKLVYEVSQGRPPFDITLSWQVEPDEGVKVELLPAPGEVKPGDKLQFPLGKSSGSETLTLKATNKSGEQVSQSVVIQTVELKPSPRPAPATPGGTAPSSPSPSGTAKPSTTPPPTPSDPDRLSPIELPPKP